MLLPKDGPSPPQQDLHFVREELKLDHCFLPHIPVVVVVGAAVVVGPAVVVGAGVVVPAFKVLC